MEFLEKSHTVAASLLSGSLAIVVHVRLRESWLLNIFWLKSEAPLLWSESKEHGSFELELCSLATLVLKKSAATLLGAEVSQRLQVHTCSASHWPELNPGIWLRAKLETSFPMENVSTLLCGFVGFFVCGLFCFCFFFLPVGSFTRRIPASSVHFWGLGIF